MTDRELVAIMTAVPGAGYQAGVESAGPGDDVIVGRALEMLRIVDRSYPPVPCRDERIGSASTNEPWRGS